MVPAEVAVPSPQLIVAPKAPGGAVGSLAVKLATCPLKTAPSMAETAVPVAMTLGITVMSRLAELFAVFGSKVWLRPETVTVSLPVTLGMVSEKIRLRIIVSELPEASEAAVQGKALELTQGAMEGAGGDGLRGAG